jgi:uncharacterized membrane protein
MRTSKDRLRHTILFEIILLLVATPVMSYFMDRPMGKVSGLAAFFSLTAMTWNYVYNIVFDKVLIKMNKSVSERGFTVRAVHATLFEIGMAMVAIPVAMIALNISFMQSVVLEIGFLIGIPIYAFIYNLIYDQVFPIPAEAGA